MRVEQEAQVRRNTRLIERRLNGGPARSAHVKHVDDALAVAPRAGRHAALRTDDPRLAVAPTQGQKGGLCAINQWRRSLVARAVPVSSDGDPDPSPCRDARPDFVMADGGRRPDFFMVGAPKCGTTSLHRWLVGHPDIFMPVRPKEPMFFVNDRLAHFGMVYPDDLPRYLALFGAAGRARRVGEASTSYLEAPEAAGRIHEFNPEARVIAMLRDPVEMIASLHAMRVSQGLEHMADLSAALADERRRPGFGVVGDQSSIRYRDRTRFATMLRPWFETFARERVNVVILEDVAAQPAVEFRRTLQFLEVDPAYSPPSFARHNEREWPRSLFLARVQARLRGFRSSDGAWDRLAGRAYHLLGRVNRARGVEPRPIPNDLRRQLRDELGPDVDALSRLLGRDMRQVWWIGNAA
jgi:hypothetical protein